MTIADQSRFTGIGIIKTLHFSLEAQHISCFSICVAGETVIAVSFPCDVHRRRRANVERLGSSIRCSRACSYSLCRAGRPCRIAPPRTRLGSLGRQKSNIQQNTQKLRGLGSNLHAAGWGSFTAEQAPFCSEDMVAQPIAAIHAQRCGDDEPMVC